MKRLAFFLDGTWNEISDNTNIWRLKALCADRSKDGTKQCAYYDIGVNGFFGGTFGKGLSENVVQAYEWLVDNYEDGDEIYIFGFSRGAYTARALAGLITKHGVLRAGAPIGVGQLFERYRRVDDTTIWSLMELQRKGELKNATLEEQRIMKFSRCVNIQVVAVFDTVGSLGVPMLSIPRISRSTLGFLHTGLRTPMLHCYHALAIDEHRYAFNPTIWTVHQSDGAPMPIFRTLERCEQRWFAGAHSDVGGGCKDDVLAQLPLQWIIRKASTHGLEFKSKLQTDGDHLTAPISDSYGEFLRGIYKGFSWPVDRTIDAPPSEPEWGGLDHNVNETIDVSVFDRWRANKSYRPESLKPWAAKHKVKIENLKSSVRANKPSEAAADD